MIPTPLEKLFSDYQNVVPELRLNERLTELRQISEEISRHQFSLAVIGEFATGKSTLINAMIGRDLLPAHAIPTTKKITTISFDDRDSLTVTPNSSESLKLTSDNIKVLTEDPNITGISITVMPSAFRGFQNFKIIDTPGANDPSELDDEIIFDIFDQADVILFLLKVNQAYNESEQKFLKRAVLKKDLAKFFFLINKADTSAEGFAVRRHVIDRLKIDLGAEETYLRNHVINISGKRALDAMLSGNEAKLAESGFTRLTEEVNRFVTSNSGQLLKDVFVGRVNKEMDDLLTETALLQEQYRQGISGDGAGLNRIEDQIKSIETMIESNRSILFSGIQREKRRLSDRISSQCDTITDRIISFIDNEAPYSASNPRQVELYADKLLREMTAEEFKNFQEEVQRIVGEFDVAVNQRAVETSVVFQTQRESHYLKSGLKIAGLGTAGLAAMSYGPAVAGIAIGGTLLTTIGTSIIGALGITTLPIWGTAALGAATMAGAVVSGAVRGAWKIVYTTAKEVGKWADSAEKAIGRTRFKQQIRNSMAAIRDEMIQRIGQMTDEQVNQWINAHFAAKFPQRQLLEQHRKEVTERLKEGRDRVEQSIANLESFRIALEVERDILKTNFSKEFSQTSGGSNER